MGAPPGKRGQQPISLARGPVVEDEAPDGLGLQLQINHSKTIH
jgi:hypothetical protein